MTVSYGAAGIGYTYKLPSEFTTNQDNGASLSDGGSSQAGFYTDGEAAFTSYDTAGATTCTVTTTLSGIVFNNTFTANVSQVYRNCIVAAEQTIQSEWSNPITINVTFDAQNNGQNGGLASNSFPLFQASYSQLRTALGSHAASSIAQAAVASLPPSDPSSGAFFGLPVAYARMLGLTSNAPATDDTVILNTGYNWSFGQDVTNTVIHELSEGGMGRFGGLGDSLGGRWSTMDLFRYSSAGVRDFTDGRDGNATFFSYNGSQLSSLSFNNDYNSSGIRVNGGDTADFTQLDVFGTGSPGEINTLSQTDLQVMDALDWMPASPPPPPPPPPAPAQDVFFAPGQPINVVTSTTGTNLPTPVSGQFNLELIINATGTGSYVTAPGYQGVAIVSSDSHTLTLLHGNYGAVDTGGHQLIIAGDGSESIGGAAFDTILGGSGISQFLDGHAGNQSIIGGSGGNETIWGAATDTVRGGSGGNETIGGVSGETIFGSTGANVFINATGGNQSIVGGNAGNATVWTASGDTIRGGSDNETVGGVAGVTMIGGTGGNQFLDASQGHQSITGGSGGNETIWGAATDTVRGGSGGNETIGGVSGETISGGSGANLFVAAMNGNMSIVGGTAGNMTVWAGAGDTIRGGSDNETIGGVAGVTVIGGSGGNEFIDGSLGGQSITGGSGGNETIWGAVSDTIRGGSAGNDTIGSVAGESVTGGAANTVIDASAGNQWIALGAGNSTVFGGAHDTILGASGTGSAQIAFSGGNETLWDNGSSTSGHDSVTGFNQAAGDRVSLSSVTDTVSAVLASATSIGGNVVLHLGDSSSITLVGVTPLMLNSGFFTTH